MNELTPLNDEQKKSVEAFGEAMQHEVIPAVLKDRDERFYAAIQQAIKDPMTPGGVQAAYAVLLDDNAALRAKVEALEQCQAEVARNLGWNEGQQLTKQSFILQQLATLTAEQGRLRDALEKIDEYMSARYNADHPANVMLKAALRGEGG